MPGAEGGSSMPVTLPNPVQLGVVGAAQGLRGEVRIKTFTGDPLSIGAYGPLFAEDGRRFTVKEVRLAKNVAIVRFAEISDRNAAEALNGTPLFVDRSALPPDLDDDEYYHADLIGLEVRNETGKRLGRLKAIHDFGAGDVLEVSGAGPTKMVPFTRAAVPHIDIQAGCIHVESRAAGLVEEEDDEAGERR